VVWVVVICSSLSVGSAGTIRHRRVSGRVT
jgi:hypothetical protein